MQRLALLLTVLLALAVGANAKEPGAHPGDGCTRGTPVVEPPTDEPPSDALLGTLGILRQPASEADVFPDPLPENTVGGVHRNHVRQAAIGPSGERVFVLAARHVQIGIPASCPSERRYYLRGQKEGVVVAIAWPFSAPPEWKGTRPPSGFFVSSFRPLPTEEIVAGDRYLIGPDANPSTVYDVLPDGVARVTYVYPKGRTWKGGKSYRKRTVVTAAVKDNVAVVKRVGRGFDSARPALQIWKDADGKVLKRIESRRKRR